MAALSHCASNAGAKTGATPVLSAPTTMKYYRRSTTNKAPRKRTFLVTMTKFDSTLVSPPGVASAFADNAAMLSGRSICYEDIPARYGGDGGNNGGNNNNSNFGNNGFSGDEAPRGIFHLGHALLGAFAITVAIAAFPAHSTAASALLGGSASSSASAVRPRKVLHVATRDGTLVVPLPANGDAKAFQRAKVVDAPIQLTRREAAMVDGRQYRVRESMLVQ